MLAWYSGAVNCWSGLEREGAICSGLGARGWPDA